MSVNVEYTQHNVVHAVMSKCGQVFVQFGDVCTYMYIPIVKCAGCFGMLMMFGVYNEVILS